MIVKDESHVIIDTLTKLCKKINFDYWVISDTGSTDNTKELIKNFFNEKKIKGELFDDKWENFGHNRSLALKHAYKKTDYVLIFDADDEIVGDFKLPEIMNLGGYHLIMGNENGFVYARLALVSNQIRWEYKGVLHEFIQCMENPGSVSNIEGNYYINSGKCGSRSKNPNKYADDAMTLEKAYYKAVEEKDDLYKRYAFYCANSYFDSNNVEKAIEWYKRTLDLPTWEQEKITRFI
jgi:glycosyltransferase involved in cell wall biosynthesis